MVSNFLNGKVHTKSTCLPVSMQVKSIDVSLVVPSNKGIARAIKSHVQKPQNFRMVFRSAVNDVHYNSAKTHPSKCYILHHIPAFPHRVLWGLPACLCSPGVRLITTSKQFRKPFIMKASSRLFTIYPKTYCQNWRNQTLGNWQTRFLSSCHPQINIQTVCVMLNRQQGLRVCRCNIKCSKMT